MFVFLGELKIPKRHFEINWPLGIRNYVMHKWSSKDSISKHSHNTIEGDPNRTYFKDWWKTFQILQCKLNQTIKVQQWIVKSSFIPTYCFDQAICNLLWLQNHELKSQKEQLKTKISMKLHISISLSLKFMFSKKVTKNYKIFPVDLTLTKLTSNWRWRFHNFCGLLRKHEL